MAAPKYSKKKLIRESIRLFYKDGYQNTTMRKIADASGISHPAIFAHFKNKAQIGTLLIYRYINGVVTLTRRYIADTGIDPAMNHEPLVFYWTIHFHMMKEDQRLFNFSREFYASQDIYENESSPVFLQMFLDLLQGSHSQDLEQNLEDLKLQTQLVSTVASIMVYNCYAKRISLEKAVIEYFNLLYSILKIQRNISVRDIEAFLSRKAYLQYLNFNLLEEVLLTDFGREYPHPPALSLA